MLSFRGALSTQQKFMTIMEKTEERNRRLSQLKNIAVKAQSPLHLESFLLHLTLLKVLGTTST